jgi:RND family efflux transporter MFP subunit
MRSTERTPVLFVRSLCLAGLLAASLLGGCQKSAADATKADAGPMLLAPEDVLTLRSSDLAAGPVITGTIQPERKADLRAEVAAVVVQMLKDNGETVHTGDLLVRLDETAIRDNVTSADEAARAASQAFDQAQRQVDRQKTLQAQGMTSMSALEDAEIRRNSTQSDLVAAKARLVSARQQLERTSVRAPFDGVVSDRQASAGDTAQIGKELLKVIDPGSMRFEGLVSADHMQDLRVGQAVRFRVNGTQQSEYVGKIRRIDPAVNDTTGQVGVIVDFTDKAAMPRVAGLFAEGRVETGTQHALMVPDSALVRAGQQASVWLLRGQTLVRTTVKLGDRDPRSGLWPILDGAQAGDRLLRQPGSTLTDGQKFSLTAGGNAASAAR